MSFRFVLLLLLAALAMAAETEYLALCNQCLNPIVTSKTGIGTANAVADAVVTREGLKGWCENWQPGNLASCMKGQAAEVGHKYRATADCTRGRITTADGSSYAFAGIWADGDGKGRSRWRDAANGAAVGQDNASGGLGISQQWELLCPGSPGTPGAAARRQAVQAQAAAAAPPAPSLCGGQADCAESNTFAANVTDFRPSTVGRARILTATVRFRNKTNRPIILGYVPNSGIITDDQGNRYGVYTDENVRGIGVISARGVDTKFVLQPGEGSDGRFEFSWQPTGREIIGTAFHMDLTVREIVPVGNGSQLRLGKEHFLQFRNVGQSAVSAAPPQAAPLAAAAPVAASPAASAIPAAPAPDACEGKPRCYSAGPFAAEVLSLTGSIAGNKRDHVVRVNVRFRNVSNQPIILAYTARSSVLVDNLGNRYYWGTAGTYDTSASGIGIVQGNKADPQFVLNPGESRSAAFGLFRRGATGIGTSFTYDVSIEQLEVLASQQIRTLRQHTLNFPDLGMAGGGAAAAPTQNVGEAAQKLRDIFKRRK